MTTSPSVHATTSAWTSAGRRASTLTGDAACFFRSANEPAGAASPPVQVRTAVASQGSFLLDASAGRSHQLIEHFFGFT